MIDLATVALAAAAAGNAVGVIDKIYRGYADFFKKKKSDEDAPEPSFKIQNSPGENALIAKSVSDANAYQKVTYEDLQQRLSQSDLAHIKALSEALEIYRTQWDSLYVQRAMASGLELARMDTQLAYLSKQIAEPLLKVLAFVEKMGFYLDDHYSSARDIAQTELAAAGRG